MTFDTFLPFKDIFNQSKLIRTDGTGIEKSKLECQKVGGFESSRKLDCDKKSLWLQCERNVAA